MKVKRKAESRKQKSEVGGQRSEVTVSMKAPVMTEAEKALVLGDDRAVVLSDLAQLECVTAAADAAEARKAGGK